MAWSHVGRRTEIEFFTLFVEDGNPSRVWREQVSVFNKQDSLILGVTGFFAKWGFQPDILFLLETQRDANRWEHLDDLSHNWYHRCLQR